MYIWRGLEYTLFYRNIYVKKGVYIWLVRSFQLPLSSHRQVSYVEKLRIYIYIYIYIWRGLEYTLFLWKHVCKKDKFIYIYIQNYTFIYAYTYHWSHSSQLWQVYHKYTNINKYIYIYEYICIHIIYIYVQKYTYKYAYNVPLISFIAALTSLSQIYKYK
jgi:hypothetical protein